MLSAKKYFGFLADAAVISSASAMTVDGLCNDWFTFAGSSSDDCSQSSASSSRLI